MAMWQRQGELDSIEEAGKNKALEIAKNLKKEGIDIIVRTSGLNKIEIEKL